MKRLICMLLVALLAMSLAASAQSKLSEAIMIYEDYDGNRSEETIVDDKLLTQLQDILIRAKGNKATLENCTMNCTLLCKVGDDISFDFAVATDGCPYITDMSTDVTYRLADGDLDAIWEMFGVVHEAMGYDAASFMDW